MGAHFARDLAPKLSQRDGQIRLDTKLLQNGKGTPSIM